MESHLPNMPSIQQHIIGPGPRPRISIDGTTFASQLPPELQYLILKIVILYYLKSIPDMHDMLAHLVCMMGYQNSLLDCVLSMVIQELEIGIGMSLFTDVHFDEFAEFVSTRSIKLKSINFSFPLPGHPKIHTTQTQILQFLNSCCANVVPEMPMNFSRGIGISHISISNEQMQLSFMKRASSLSL
ncbi:unnamed protein product [Ambrosiozyma monospora]|uniref:Unnamed protein product n=1 Tax=Ambrosiozyma monospora TaxID=43982 RepID=A0ACB5SXH9_AMBMO|nr:unnamed protein product [Ambrosiozyma monospora]